jgi:hypothetical protein
MSCPHPATYQAITNAGAKPYRIYLCEGCAHGHVDSTWTNIRRRRLNWTREMRPRECECNQHKYYTMSEPNRRLEEENRRLRLALGEAMHELGRAISISRLQFESRDPPKQYETIINSVTGDWVIMPVYPSRRKG